MFTQATSNSYKGSCPINHQRITITY
jgi:hypothetical protein